MTETRLRGQEVTIRLSRENAIEATVTAFKDFTMAFRGRILEEGYLGETNLRYDDISDGVGGSFTVHAESQDLFVLMEFIRARQERQIDVRTSRVNATGRFSFPNGDRPRMFIKDMKFGETPVTIGGRDAYVSTGFTYNAERAKFITT